MKMYKSILILLLILTACSSKTTIIQQDKININSDIQSCTVYLDHIECKLTDGRIYYMMKTDIDAKTSYDKSAWKEQ